MPSHPDPGRPLTLVLHGPEIFDSGEVFILLSKLAPSRVIVAGVMARTAAEESGIRCEYIGIPPSRVIRDLEGPVLLANQGKTPESGRIFGEIVASHLYPRELVQVEVSSRTIFAWNPDGEDFALHVARVIGYSLERVHAARAGKSPERTIRGCCKGEAVYVNGTVIGTATAGEVVLRIEGGRLVPVSGLIPKAHGLEKVNRIRTSDLSGIWCKSGPIRVAAPRAISRNRRPGRVLCIDHCGHELYSLITPDICGIVSIGDDTTAVCGHIASHLGIPVLGIVDGDGDGIVQAAFAEGSIIAQAISERDDDIGTELAGMIPQYPVDWDNFTREMIEYLSGRIEVTQMGTPGSPDL